MSIVDSIVIGSNANVNLTDVVNQILTIIPNGGLIVNFLERNFGLDLLAVLKENDMTIPDYRVFSYFIDIEYSEYPEYYEYMTGHLFYTPIVPTDDMEFKREISTKIPYRKSAFSSSVAIYTALCIYNESVSELKSIKRKDIMRYLHYKSFQTNMGTIHIYSNNMVTNEKYLVTIEDHQYKVLEMNVNNYISRPWDTSEIRSTYEICNWDERVPPIFEKKSYPLVLIGVIFSTKYYLYEYAKYKGVLSNIYYWNNKVAEVGYAFHSKIIDFEKIKSFSNEIMKELDKYDIFIGCSSSECRKAISSHFDRKILLSPERSEGQECSSNVFNFGGVPNQYIEQFMNSLAIEYDNHLFYIIQSDDSYNRIIREYVEGFAIGYIKIEEIFILSNEMTISEFFKTFLDKEGLKIILLLTNFEDTKEYLYSLNLLKLNTETEFSSFLITLPDAYLDYIDNKQLKNLHYIGLNGIPSDDDEITVNIKAMFSMNFIPEITISSYYSIEFWIKTFCSVGSLDYDEIKKKMYITEVDTFYGKLKILDNNHAQKPFIYYQLHDNREIIIKSKCNYPIIPFPWSWLKELGASCNFNTADSPHYIDDYLIVPLITSISGKNSYYGYGLIKIVEMVVASINLEGKTYI